MHQNIMQSISVSFVVPKHGFIHHFGAIYLLIRFYLMRKVPQLNSTLTPTQAKDRYFLDSGDKVRFFFEKNSFDDDGQLKMEKEECLNKIGHCMHWHLPAFKKVKYNWINIKKKVFYCLYKTNISFITGVCQYSSVLLSRIYQLIIFIHTKY